MSFLNLDLNYFENLKTIRLVGILGPGASDLPIRLWCYCGRHPALNGILSGHSMAEIEAICGWKGAPGSMVDAMLKLRFLVKVRNTYRVNDWGEINGHILALSERGRRANEVRWSNYRLKDKLSLKHPNAIHKDDLRNPPSIPSIPITTIAGSSPAADPPVKALSQHPAHRLVRAWKRLLELPQEDYATWDKANFSRCVKSANLLLEIFSVTESTNDALEAIADCMIGVYDELTKKGLSCTLETVVKRAHDWKNRGSNANHQT